MKVQKYQDPAIRFPEFSEPWKLKPFKHLLVLTERPFKMADDGVYSLIKVRRGNNGVVSRGLYEGHEVLVKAQFKVETDDFVISKRQIVHQACGIVPEELSGSIVSNEYNVFKPSVECCIRYFDYLTYRPQMRHAFFLSCVGVHLEKMLFRTNDWLKRKFNFPSVEEQRKIAKFLTAVDWRIEQLAKKKALLEDYKKGVMQQIFTQAIRFKDDNGNDFPDWKEKNLGEVSHNVGYGMNAAATEFDGVTKYIRITDIDENSNKFRPHPVTSPDEPAGDQYKLQKGDIVLARTGASVGKSYLYDEADGNLAFAGFLIRFSIREDVANPAFIFLQTQTHDYWRWVNVYSIRTGQPGINAEEYKIFTIQLPSLPEQTKIAHFLSAIDRRIENVATQVTETQTFKRGLLQQMFV